MAFKLGNAITVDKSQCGLDAVDNVKQLPLAQKGIADGVATLDTNGFVPLAQMNPSTKAVTIVEDIAERNAIIAEQRFTGMRVVVLDATADPTVNSGGATYILKSGQTDADWYKTSEEESMDVDHSVFLNKTSDSLDDVNAGSINKHFTDTEKTKLAGIAEGATQNMTDAELLNRANHTGTQAASTISNLQSTCEGYIAAAQKGLLEVRNDSNDLPAVPAGFVINLYLKNDAQGQPNGLYIWDGTELNVLFEE